MKAKPKARKKRKQPMPRKRAAAPYNDAEAELKRLLSAHELMLSVYEDCQAEGLADPVLCLISADNPAVADADEVYCPCCDTPNVQVSAMEECCARARFPDLPASAQGIVRCIAQLKNDQAVLFTTTTSNLAMQALKQTAHIGRRGPAASV